MLSSILAIGFLISTTWAQHAPMPMPRAIPTIVSNSSSWPPSDIGVPITSQAPDEELQAMLREVSASNIESSILKLVSFGTRHTLSTQNSSTRGIGAARDWIASEFRKYAEASEGRMTVSTPGYTQGIANRISFPVKISNVLATIRGSETPERVYVITGHYDSRVSDVMDYTSDAPGANDDASGTAGKFHFFFFLSSKVFLLACWLARFLKIRGF